MNLNRSARGVQSSQLSKELRYLFYFSMNKHSVLLSIVLFFCGSLGFAQNQPVPQRDEQPAQQAAPSPSPQGSPKATPNARVEIEQVPEPEHKLTPQEAQELLASVDEVLHFVSQDTLLPVKHPVKKQIVSREQVEKY